MKEKEPMASVTFKLTRRLRNALEEGADKSYRSLSNHIVMLLEKAIEEAKSEAPDRTTGS